MSRRSRKRVALPNTTILLGIFVGVLLTSNLEFFNRHATAAQEWVDQQPEKPQAERVVSSINPQAMIDKAKPYSEVKIPAGIYPMGLRILKPITLDLDGVELLSVSDHKGVLNINAGQGPVTIRNFRINAQNGAAQHSNLAGIRISGIDFNVTLDKVEIRKTAIGIMTDNRGGVLSIHNSVIEDAGYYKKQGLSHNIYVGSIESLEITNSVIRRSHHLGHLLKSRAKSTSLMDTRVLGLDSHHSRVIDIPCGGKLNIKHSILQSSSISDNQDLIAIGVESSQNCVHGLLGGDVEIQDSAVIFDRAPPASLANRLFSWKTGVDRLVLNNLKLVSRGNAFLLAQRLGGHSLSYYATAVTIFTSRKQAKFNSLPDTPL